MRRDEILAKLAAGEITVEEASKLLDEVEATDEEVLDHLDEFDDEDSGDEEDDDWDDDEDEDWDWGGGYGDWEPAQTGCLLVCLVAPVLGLVASVVFSVLK